MSWSSGRSRSPAGAAPVHRELSAAAKATLREAPWQPDFDAAVDTEITRQSWSLGQGWFRPRTTE